jgi:hypothetical protein
MTRLGKTGSFAIGVMHPLIYNHAVHYLGMDVVQFSFNTGQEFQVYSPNYKNDHRVTTLMSNIYNHNTGHIHI